jgi:hypothetical protein
VVVYACVSSSCQASPHRTISQASQKEICPNFCPKVGGNCSGNYWGAIAPERKIIPHGKLTPGQMSHCSPYKDNCWFGIHNNGTTRTEHKNGTMKGITSTIFVPFLGIPFMCCLNDRSIPFLSMALIRPRGMNFSFPPLFWTYPPLSFSIWAWLTRNALLYL